MSGATFFFYGTLMDPAVLVRVTGVSHPTARLRPAVLEGYRCVRVAGQHYPAVTPADGCRVSGRLFRGASDEAARRIDRYEEPTYARKAETVLGPGGIRVKAWVYVAGPTMPLTDEAWDFDAWCRQHRRAFLGRLDGYLRGD